MAPQLDAYYLPKEVAQILRMHPESIWRWLREEKLPALKEGNRYKIPKKQFDNWRRKRTTGV